MVEIDEIREITRKNELINNDRLQRRFEKQERIEAKNTQKIIAKINKRILKTAKQGEYKLWYEPKILLTNRQYFDIMEYFRKEGYSIISKLGMLGIEWCKEK